MNVALQPFTVTDIPRLISWVPSADFLLQWSGSSYSYPLNREQIEAFLVLATGDEPEVMVYRAVDSDSAEVVGHIELLNIDRRNRSLTIGRVLVGPPDRRGRGLGQRIVREALRIAFDDLGMHRVGLAVFDFNIAALTCYEKVGFRREGVLRDYRRVGDQYWTLVTMSILEDEWRTGRQRH